MDTVLEEWATAEKPAKAEYSSYCTCYYCDKCDSGTDEEKCSSCGEETRSMAESCSGECWEFKQEDFAGLLDEWLERNGHPEYIRIQGSNMGWLHRSGYKDLDTVDPYVVLRALTLDGDFTLYVSLADKELSVTRSSHDEMGAHMILVPVFNKCRDCDGPCPAEEIVCFDCIK